MTRLEEPQQLTHGRERPGRGSGAVPESEYSAPGEREAVRTWLLENGVVLPQLVDVWLASWELEAEYRELDSTSQGYWETGCRWILAKSLRPD